MDKQAEAAQAQPQPNPVPLSPELFSQMMQTLAQRPWAEVAGLMSQLIAANKAANPQ